MKVLSILFLVTLITAPSYACGFADEEKMQKIAEIRQELDSINRHSETADSLCHDCNTSQELSLDIVVASDGEDYDESCADTPARNEPTDTIIHNVSL